MPSLRRLFAAAAPPAETGARPRPELPAATRRVYAIGDVHGCLPQLRALEALIRQDAEATDGLPATMIVLGDVVDRGPDAAAVVDHLLRPAPPGFSRLVLAGNHEADMLAAFADPARARAWFALGGLETLRSYGVDLGAEPRSRREARAAMLRAESTVPREHLAFLRRLPAAASWRGFVFAHAGCRPGRALAEQTEADLLTIREPFLGGWGESGPIVVHGHTPVPAPGRIGARIELDTACYATGRLSAVRLGGDEMRFLSTGTPAGRFVAAGDDRRPAPDAIR